MLGWAQAKKFTQDLAHLKNGFYFFIKIHFSELIFLLNSFIFEQDFEPKWMAQPIITCRRQ